MRTFLALELPSEFKDQLNRISLKLQSHNLKNIKWVNSQNLHITLLFIGEIDHSIVNNAADAFGDLFAELKAVEFEDPQIKLIPPRKPHLIWVEYQCRSKVLKSVHKELLKILPEFGCTPDKKHLRFHVTLGRIKGYLSTSFISETINTIIPSISFKSNIITYYQSILRQSGPEYIPLAEYHLK